jgi:hypothetical protein
LHVRPYIDLGDPRDREKMRAIAEDVYTLAWSLGGTISGEHAVGLIRAGFVARGMGCVLRVLRVKESSVARPGGPGRFSRGSRRDVHQPRRHPFPERAKSEMLFRTSWSWSSRCMGAGWPGGSRRCACVPCSGRRGRNWAARAPRPICSTIGRRASLRKRTSSRPSSASSWICASTARCASGVLGCGGSTLMAARARYVRRKGLGPSSFGRNRYLSKMTACSRSRTCSCGCLFQWR